MCVHVRIKVEVQQYFVIFNIYLFNWSHLCHGYQIKYDELEGEAFESELIKRLQSKSFQNVMK